MNRFSGEWLRLREPHDHRARSAPGPVGLVATLAERLRARGGANIIDLGSGTGSNLRYLGPRLTGDQNWTLVDNDGHLLARVGQACTKWARKQGWAVQPNGRNLILSDGGRRLVVRLRRHDLKDLGGLTLADYDLVTGSALLDLVSKTWLTQLAAALGNSGTAVYFALSADGRLRWTPARQTDRRMAALFHRDLARDKGLGPAAGVDAARQLAGLLAHQGYQVMQVPSDWTIRPTEPAMLGAMIDFVSDAARRQAPRDGARLSVWTQSRRRQLRRGKLSLSVGHQELLALM